LFSCFGSAALADMRAGYLMAKEPVCPFGCH
jgi:hypothetical protein